MIFLRAAFENCFKCTGKGNICFDFQKLMQNNGIQRIAQISCSR
jgi:hypothetical protein